MGTPVTIHLRAADVPDGMAQAVTAVYAELRRLDGIFSTDRQDSAVNLLAEGRLSLEQCPPEVTEVLDLCALAGKVTGGAFDARRPTPDGGTRLDPSGLVKGWALERAADSLRKLAGADFCIDAGADLLCHVAGPDRPAWHVGTGDPGRPDTGPAVFTVRDGGVAILRGGPARSRHRGSACDGDATARPTSVTVSGPTLLWAHVLAAAVYDCGDDAADWATIMGYHVDVLP